MRIAKPFVLAFAVALAALAAIPAAPAPAAMSDAAILVDTNGDGKADKAYIIRDADDGSIVGV